jgi:hypothetical protein
LIEFENHYLECRIWQAGNRRKGARRRKDGIHGKISSPASLVYESSLPDVESDGDEGGLPALFPVLDGDAWEDWVRGGDVKGWKEAAAKPKAAADI